MSKYTKLDPEFKAKWVTALRERHYRQGHGSLRERILGNKYEYCCLGVGCNLISPKKWKKERSTSYGWGNATSGSDELPFVNLATATRLIAMNDDQERDFSYIADWIEKYL